MQVMHYTEPGVDATTSQRFEPKYIINEARARAVASFIQPFVHPDPHGAEYPIASVYLDSPDLALYRSSTLGEKNRFKLRVRSYGDAFEGVAFLEIKRRLDQIIRKERVAMSVGESEKVMAGLPNRSRHEAAREHRDSVSFCHFRDLAERLNALPKVYILYMREAYVSAFDSPVRITFDRRIVCLPYSLCPRTAGHPVITPYPVLKHGVVLEIKFTNTSPVWVRRMVQRFDLERRSVCKYVMSVDTLRRQGVRFDAPFAGGLQ